MPGKILYFIGAGASKAAWSRMPLMTDFLQLGFEYAQANKNNPDEAWPYFKMMGYQETIGDGVWVSDPTTIGRAADLEVFGPSPSVSYHDLGQAIVQAQTPSERKQAADKYLERLEFTLGPGYSTPPSILSRKRASIEWLLTRAETYALNTDNDRPFQATKEFIVWLLGKLEHEMASNGAPNAFDHLCAAIQSQNYFRLTRFVSFNYDVLLERALAKLNPPKPQRQSGNIVWTPHEDFGVGFERYFRLDDVTAGRPPKPTPFQTTSRGTTLVLKPHGSLYWFLEQDGDKWDGPLLDDSDPSLTMLPPPGDTFLKLASHHLSAPAAALEPVLIPPSPTKAAAGKLFWDTWQGIDKELQECESVVVIGWNMPATDADIQTRIAASLSKRRHPISKVLVCDMRKSDIFYHRFVAAFRPKAKVDSWREGFSERFVKERLVPELMPQKA